MSARCTLQDLSNFKSESPDAFPLETPSGCRPAGVETLNPTMSDGISHILTNKAVPGTEATITVRVIKSFEYRTERSLVLHKLNLETTTVGGLKEIVRQCTLDYCWIQPPISLIA